MVIKAAGPGLEGGAGDEDIREVGDADSVLGVSN